MSKMQALGDKMMVLIARWFRQLIILAVLIVVAGGLATWWGFDIPLLSPALRWSAASLGRLLNQ